MSRFLAIAGATVRSLCGLAFVTPSVEVDPRRTALRWPQEAFYWVTPGFLNQLSRCTKIPRERGRPVYGPRGPKHPTVSARLPSSHCLLVPQVPQESLLLGQANWTRSCCCSLLPPRLIDPEIPALLRMFRPGRVLSNSPFPWPCQASGPRCLATYHH